MKNQIFLITISMIAAVVIISCGKKSDTEKTMQNKTQYYKTIDEASEKAKSDLQEMLKMDIGLDMKINLKELEQSKPQGNVKQYLVDINKLISGDTLQDFIEISIDEGVTIVPFVYKNKFIATASLSKDKAGWKVAGMFNNKITSDLNFLKRYHKKGTEFEVRYFEVPNINAHIYQFTADTVSRYFTDYKKMFSLEKETSLARLITILKRDAAEFQKKYGDKLKKNELLM